MWPRLAGEPMAELCREFGIPRKTGYKIFDRFQDAVLKASLLRSPSVAGRSAFDRQLLYKVTKEVFDAYTSLAVLSISTQRFYGQPS